MFKEVDHPKLCENCAFPQNIHTMKLGEITVFKVVICTLPSLIHSLGQNILRGKASS